MPGESTTKRWEKNNYNKLNKTSASRPIQSVSEGTHRRPRGVSERTRAWTWLFRITGVEFSHAWFPLFFMFFSMPPPIFTSGSIREKIFFFSEPLFPEGERKKKKMTMRLVHFLRLVRVTLISILNMWGIKLSYERNE